MTRDQKVPGSKPVRVAAVWTYTRLAPDWFIKGLAVCKTVYGRVYLEFPLESVEKSRGLSPGSGFLSRRYVNNSDERKR